MIKQHLMDAVDRAEKLLIETLDTVNKICRVIGDDLEEQGHGYVATFQIKEAFKDKHGMGMTKYREQRTGIKNNTVVKKANKEQKAPTVELAKRLLENTEFSVGEVGRLCGLRGSALSGVFKYFGLPTPRQYRSANFKQDSIYAKQKVTRKRIHVNGGMRLKQNFRGEVTAWLAMADHVGDNAVLSISVTGLSFTLSQVDRLQVISERVAIKDTILVTTGFATPMKDTYSESQTMTVKGVDGHTVRFILSYDLVARVMSLEFIGQHASNIEFTALITTTHM